MQKKIIFSLLVVSLIIPIYGFGCSSDFDCGIGYRCIKAPFNTTGTCMKNVDEYGTQKYELPRTDSIYPRTQGDCNFDTDCPIGFYCDRYYKVCIKR